MLSILNVVLPVFALIALGYGAVRFRFYPAEGIKGVLDFVNNFATPCLLFQGMLNADFSQAFNPAIIFPFYIGALAIMVVGYFAARRVFKLRPGEAVASGFAAMFTNTVLVGIPILQRAYGDAALPFAFSIITFHAPALITLAMLTMELVRRDAQPLGTALRVAGLRIVQNPLLWGVGLGALANFSGAVLPEPAEAFVGMMAQAVLPAALFGLGGALNAYKLSESWGPALINSGLKLIIHPLIVYLLIVQVFHVDRDIARYGVLLAAMPTGINAYIFATYYNRAVNVAANTVLLATMLSVLTISFWLYVMSL